MRSLYRILALTSLIVSLTAFAHPPSFEPAAASWRTGQILAISEPLADVSTLFFELATGSRFGHMGIVSVESDGIFVYHSNPPQTQRTPLAVFLARALRTDKSNYSEVHQRFLAMQRLKGRAQVEAADSLLNDYEVLATQLEFRDPMSRADKRLLRETLERFVKLQIPYNFDQCRNKKSLNCSEFLFEVFGRIGRSVGTPQLIADLNLRTVHGLGLKLWESTSAMAPIDRQSEILSPASVVMSPALEIIASNLPADHLISDHEILKAWIQSGAFHSKPWMVVAGHALKLFASRRAFAEEILSTRKDTCAAYLFTDR